MNTLDAGMLRKLFLDGANNLSNNKEYINELNEKLEAPKKEYGVKRYWQLPEEVQEEFFRNVDKTVSAQVNMDLVDKIDAFYTGILNKEL